MNICGECSVFNLTGKFNWQQFFLHLFLFVLMYLALGPIPVVSKRRKDKSFFFIKHHRLDVS